MSVIHQFSSFYNDLSSMKVSDLGSIYSTDIIFIDPIAAHEGLESVKSYFTRLLENAKHCHFAIHHIQETTDNNYWVTWTMEFTSTKMKNGKPICVDGVTHLKVLENKITFHRDYYDLGQMVYENIPLLGRIIKRIKKGMA